ncbi:BCCT family transporter [Caldalkalibacillus salinus]|uniref:BCCT family transporter n=1 Tax=Caldalkalibacillus salinus TaxID=2803787 RepID=UPI001922437C
MKLTQKLDWPVFIISGGLLFLFVILSFINSDTQLVSQWVDESFAFSVSYFGAFWQVLMLATFIIAIVLAFSRLGKVRLGNIDKPEISTFRWIAIIMCTLLAGGGVFWAAAEPMYHFMSTPPMFPGIESGTSEAIAPALAQSFLDWGFSAWAILGTLSTIILMYGHYHKGLPLKPRTLLHPIFGDKILQKSVVGTLVDAFSIIAVAAGTIGPIGFLGLQAAYGLEFLFDVPNVFTTHIIIIGVLVTIASISAVTGIHRGIQLLSRWNIILTLVLVGLILFIGPGRFIIDNFIGSYAVYIENFLSLSLYRAAPDWLGWWTVFFWGWFIGYAPMMAIFVSRISRGRTLREIVLAVAIIAPIVTNFWFTVVGGSGIHFELQNNGVISGPLEDGGLPATMMAITQQLPMPLLMSVAFLIVTIVFVATTTDSMSYTISVAMTGEGDPASSLRVFWAVIMGSAAAALLLLGEGSITAIQNFIVVTAVPVSIILLPTLWLAPQVAKQLAHEQEQGGTKETSIN